MFNVCLTGCVIDFIYWWERHVWSSTLKLWMVQPWIRYNSALYRSSYNRWLTFSKLNDFMVSGDLASTWVKTVLFICDFLLYGQLLFTICWMDFMDLHGYLCLKPWSYWIRLVQILVAKFTFLTITNWWKLFRNTWNCLSIKIVALCDIIKINKFIYTIFVLYRSLISGA